MIDKKSFLKGLLSFSFGKWAQALVSFASTPIITMLVSPEDFGKSAMFAVSYGLLQSVLLLGTDQSFVRFFYEREDEDNRRKLLYECVIPPLVVRMIFSILLINFWKTVSYLLFGGYYLLPILILSVILVSGIFENTSLLILRMKKKGKLYSLVLTLDAVFIFSFTVFFALILTDKFMAIILGFSLSRIIRAFVLFLIERNTWLPPPHLKGLGFREALKYGLPFIPVFAINWLFQSMDRIALRSFSSFNELGLYAVAYKVVSIINLVQIGFSTFWIPVAYEHFKKHPEDKVFFTKVTQLIAAIMFFIAFSIITFKDIIFLIVASPYRGAALVSPFLVFIPTLFAISETTHLGINFMKKPYYHIIISLFSALANYIGNFLLVPILGARGAAISTGLSYIIFFHLRTMISIKLYPVEYKLSRISFSIFILVGVAIVNTFTSKVPAAQAISLMGLLLVAFLYRKEIYYLVKSLREIIAGLRV
ncbi:MAG: lipopolysaccharide biosynthesis protein [Candidatus Aenigmatarchaeota archaeon]|nr:MAG: lipopolysaccharide biosynthesis protein [Candidatus Aenigmarchaeota archaeon]